MTDALPYSKGRIDRAGKVLSRTLIGAEPLPSTDELAEAKAVAEAFRKAHRAPMVSARMSLQSCIGSEGLEVVELTQRLKRMPTVVDKLRRLPTMKLSSMQDIGGCRAVFATQAAVARVQERFMANSARRNGADDTVRDYVARPRDSGYRACHLWTRYGDRRVEVQLRTRVQHGWAKLVEDITALTGTDYKSGDGAHEVHAWLRLLSKVHELAETGLRTGKDFDQEYAEARKVAWSRIIDEVEGRERGHG